VVVAVEAVEFDVIVAIGLAILRVIVAQIHVSTAAAQVTLPATVQHHVEVVAVAEADEVVADMIVAVIAVAIVVEAVIHASTVVEQVISLASARIPAVEAVIVEAEIAEVNVVADVAVAVVEIVVVAVADRATTVAKQAIWHAIAQSRAHRSATIVMARDI